MSQILCDVRAMRAALLARAETAAKAKAEAENNIRELDVLIERLMTEVEKIDAQLQENDQ